MQNSSYSLEAYNVLRLLSKGPKQIECSPSTIKRLENNGIIVFADSLFTKYKLTDYGEGLFRELQYIGKKTMIKKLEKYIS